MKVKVKLAAYGAGRNIKDVTDKVQKMLDSGTTVFNASDADWGDPAFGTTKALVILWRKDDDDKTTEVGITVQGTPGITINVS